MDLRRGRSRDVTTLAAAPPDADARPSFDALYRENRDAVFGALQKYNAEAKRNTFDEQFPAQADTWLANNGVTGMLDLVEADWESTLKLMHSAGMINKVVDPKTFLDPSFITKAKA